MVLCCHLVQFDINRGPYNLTVYGTTYIFMQRIIIFWWRSFFLVYKLNSNTHQAHTRLYLYDGISNEYSWCVRVQIFFAELCHLLAMENVGNGVMIQYICQHIFNIMLLYKHKKDNTVMGVLF